jgi:hypothetical protein
MNKKGEATTAGNVATLIALIALFMVVYLLLLPQEDRDQLLFGNESRPRLNGVDFEDGVLLSEFVGKLIPGESPQIITHDIANANLFTNEETGLITLSDSVLVTRSLFGSNERKLFFNVDNSDDFLKAEIYMIVDSGSGNLIMKLNGNEFYNKEVRSGQIKAEIPLAYLSDNNELELSIGGFGSKTYQLRDLRLRKQAEVKNRVARRTFSIADEEKARMDRAVMRYSVFCNRNEDKTLKMFLNEKVLFSDVPFCNLKEEVIEIAPHYFDNGVNTLDFETEGDYVVEGIRIKTFAGREETPDYFFSLDTEDYTDVRRGIRNIIAVFEFSVLDDRKVFNMEINDNEIEVDTTDDLFLFVLNDYIEQENLIKLDAKNSFEILEFKIALE